MAQKRMFSLSVVDTDKFLEMPISSRLLYYELGMRADDDGFVDNWKKILAFTGLKEDDMKVLIAKQFVIPFESGIIVIRHWRMNNYLQNDRTRPTIHQEELKELELDNGVYVLTRDDFNSITLDQESISAKEKRKIAYEESELPYSFDYKIRNIFTDKICPLCGYKMSNYVNAPHRPTIQHNIPISKGGKHELGNISVICHKCNVSTRDKITGKLNSEEVKEEWEKINRIQGCIHSIDKNSIVEISIDNKKENIKRKKFVKPTPEEIHQYCLERNNFVNWQQFYDFYESKGWKVGNQPMKDWKACVRTWERKNKDTKNSNVPEWFDEKIEAKQISKQDSEKLEDLIKKYKEEQ